MRTSENLREILRRIDGKGYKVFKDIRGSYDFGRYELHIDHVQGDPFAAPSKIRVRVAMAEADLEDVLFSSTVRRRAFEDFLARGVHKAIEETRGKQTGSGKSGMMIIDVGGQEVLWRSACRVEDEWVEARLYVGLPAAGRRILGKHTEEMFFNQLPAVVEKSLMGEHIPWKEARDFVDCIENQEYIRGRLHESGLVAFIGNGAVLPRSAGHSQRPLTRGKAVLFQCPESLRVEIELPNPPGEGGRNGSKISGMGIPRGVTVLVGGGYHGKSTLLQALQRGVYPHVPGDGREYVVAVADAVKIRAEDGRRIEQVDISPFITHLPGGVSTERFSSDNASGSTSQAANIIEALESGTHLLLLDEDTSATNFMIRDRRMQSLVGKNFEPITPFIERVRELYETLGVSTVLVMGGCGDYLEIADNVVMMKNYLPEDVTEMARGVALRHPSGRRKEVGVSSGWESNRCPLPWSFNPSRGSKEVKIDAKAVDRILYGRETLDLRGVEQLVDISQTRAVGLAIHLAATRFMDGKTPLEEVVEKVAAHIQRHGLEILDPFFRPGKHPGSLAQPRNHEIAAAINRLRRMRVEITFGKE